MTGAQNLPNAAGKAIADAIEALEIAYGHAEQVLDQLEAQLDEKLGLARAGSLSARKEKDSDEGKIRLRKFVGFYLAEDPGAWNAPQPKAALKKPILFVCAVLRPYDPADVGGIYLAAGTIENFELLPGKVLSGKSADHYLPLLLGALLEESDPISDKPVQRDFKTRHATATGKCFTTRLVDLPDQNKAMELVDRIVDLWKSRK